MRDEYDRLKDAVMLDELESIEKEHEEVQYTRIASVIGGFKEL